MVNVIITIVVIGALILLGKHILFNPRINSALCIIWLFFGIIADKMPWSLFAIVAIVDCIRDIVKAKDYYEDIEIGIDRLYMIKSLLSILTLGSARIIFLFVVGPLISISVSLDVKRRIKDGYPLPYKSTYSRLAAKNYYYAKQLNKYVKQGILVSNIETVDAEIGMRRQKLDNLYPEKLLAKFTDIVAGDKAMKEKRETARNKLESWAVTRYYAYVTSASFEQYPTRISTVMSEKGCYSSCIIKDFEELSDFNFTYPVGDSTYKNTAWSEYFIIQALQPLVADGIFEDNDFNDNDPMDNHAYRYINSISLMPSIDANSDPRFALDDD